jgi:hypothetical protein
MVVLGDEVFGGEDIPLVYYINKSLTVTTNILLER